MRCAIWYHLYNLKNVKNVHGGVLLSIKLQADSCSFTKSNTPPWVFLTFFKWYYIAQNRFVLPTLPFTNTSYWLVKPDYKNYVPQERTRKVFLEGIPSVLMTCDFNIELSNSELRA